MTTDSYGRKVYHVRIVEHETENEYQVLSAGNGEPATVYVDDSYQLHVYSKHAIDGLDMFYIGKAIEQLEAKDLAE